MRNWRISQKMLFLSIAPALVTAVMLTVFFVITHYNNLDSALKERGTAIVKQLSPASEYSVVTGNVKILQSLTGAGVAQADVKSIGIYDNFGELLAHSGSEAVTDLTLNTATTKPDVIERRNTMLIFRAPIFQSELVMDDQHTLDSESYEFNLTDKVVGWVVLEMSMASTIARQQFAFVSSAVLTLVVLILTWLISSRLGSTISKPILDLSDAVKRLGDGEMTSRVKVTSGGEIKSLGDGFNAMADALAQYESNLKSKINTATHQLQKALTQLKAQNYELELERARALGANEAKSQFLANMSHELRTPLNAIIGYSEILEEDSEELGLDSFISDLQRIRGAGMHLLKLIDGVLDLSKIEAGKMELYVERIDVESVISDVVTILQQTAQKNVNQLSVQYEKSPGAIYTDATKLRQLLFNIAGNALKFTHNGQVKIVVKRDVIPDFIEFEISDTGIGMTKEQISKLFVPFTQADVTTTRKYGGTGLGLTISQHYCQMMGGTIDVDSEPDKGTVFTVRLPTKVEAGNEPKNDSSQLYTENKLLDLESDAEALRFHNGTGEERGVNLRKKVSSVLVIDDDPSVRNMLTRYLSKWGFVVRTASDGPSGLAMAYEEHPDVITLDVMMPGMDGWSVLRMLKQDENTSHIPVIMLSVINDKDRGFTLGANDFLTKPIDWRALSNVVKKNIRSQHTISVLVIDDDDETRDMINRKFSKNNWEVFDAKNGREGLAILEVKRPSIILLDLMMPVMDGFEFLERFNQHKEWKDIPVILLTAADLSSEERRFLEKSVDKIIQKSSCDMNELFVDLKNLLKSYIEDDEVATG